MVSEIVQDRLYLGDLDDSRTANEHTSAYDRVISVSRSDTENTTHHFPLHDGPKVDQKVFNEAAGCVQSGLMKGDVVLVHCAVGSSRAPSVTAAAMAVLDGTTFDESLAELEDKRPLVNPLPALRNCGEVFVEQQS